MTDSGHSATRELRSPVFVVGGLLLIAAAIGLRPTMLALDERYRKGSIDLRRRLVEFDVGALSSFRLCDERLSKDIPLDDVGTEDLLMIPLDDEQASGLWDGAILFITYYSDADDKVPHTPEVCYRQGGAVVEEMKTITLDLDMPESAPEHSRINARFLRMDQPRNNKKVIVIYVFYVNGEFRYDREQVRWITAWPGDPYIYFSKVEAVVHYAPGADPAIPTERAERLLRDVLPQLLEHHYPETPVVKGLVPFAKPRGREAIDPRRPLREFDVSRLTSFREHTRPLPESISDRHVAAERYAFIGLEEKGSGGPDAQAALLVTYYSDPEDQVPRISESCFRTGGAVSEETTTVALDTPELGPDQARVQARVLRISRSEPSAVVGYTFCVNGRFCCDYEQARSIIEKNDAPYVYFSKVEVVVPYSPRTNPSVPAARAERLLREALPVLVRDHYPKTAPVKGG